MANFSFTKFNSFTEAIAEKVHNLGSDQLKIALTDVIPVATNTQLSNLTEITYTNLTSRNLTTSSSAQTSGVYKLTIADLTLTASGSVGPFRYVVLYNDTATNKELIAWADYGGEVTMANLETFLVDLSQTNGTLTLT